jgi:spermidine/putrescine ABC transporter ATP-binding subunit
MSAIDVQRVRKTFDRTVALDDVSIAFRDGEFFGLLGPSGSGKTTLLRCVAGFVAPDSGTILFDGKPVERIPVNRRGIGMVFQHYALFPHMTVFDNVAFGLSVRGIGRSETRRRVGEMLELVRLGRFEGRKPRQLSGGQQQRVALARALVTRPKVLLLDEPLGALDKRLRQEMQIELKQIQREVGLTTIFVTHDQEEAMTLSDRIAIINDGAIVQLGPPAEIYERPATAFAASFLGEANLFSGTSAAATGRVRLDGQPDLRTTDALPEDGAPVTVAVRPEKIVLVEGADEAPPALANRLPARVVQAVYAGSSITYILDAAGRRVTAFEQNRAARRFAPGAAVAAAWEPRHTVVVRP